ncbi:MAG: AzlC family ABC transporter permease [Anaerolineales bacterium]|nr:MAG: AzlC family ABC transporter permease [Anaerolineales bacterium]
MNASRFGEFLAGIRDELPILLGVAPFGMIYGVLALSAGISAAAAQSMSFIVFAGSSQFIAAQLVASGTPAVLIVLTIGIVNLRHALYSASIAPYFRKLGPYWKWMLSYLLTDEAYAVSITRFQRENPGNPDENSDLSLRHWYFLGAGLALWSTWQLSTAVGIFLGQQVPASWSLDFTLPLTFLALVVPVLRDRASVVAALTAGVVAVMASSLPFNLGLILAALVGISAGLWSESR